MLQCMCERKHLSGCMSGLGQKPRQKPPACGPHRPAVASGASGPRTLTVRAPRPHPDFTLTVALTVAPTLTPDPYRGPIVLGMICEPRL